LSIESYIVSNNDALGRDIAPVFVFDVVVRSFVASKDARER
jgi:hypothetical protein